MGAGRSVQLPSGYREQRVTERIHALNDQLKSGLASLRHVRLHTPRSRELSSGIVCFDVDSMDPQETVIDSDSAASWEA